MTGLHDRPRYEWGFQMRFIGSDYPAGSALIVAVQWGFHAQLDGGNYFIYHHDDDDDDDEDVDADNTGRS